MVWHLPQAFIDALTTNPNSALEEIDLEDNEIDRKMINKVKAALQELIRKRRDPDPEGTARRLAELATAVLFRCVVPGFALCAVRWVCTPRMFLHS